MTAGGPIHADEVFADTACVHRLLASQMPHLAGLMVEPLPLAGTDHAMFRLGRDLAVRLPRRPGCADWPAREFAHLPALARHLTVEIPVPVALGQPDEGFPFSWTVCRWVEGETVDPGAMAHSVQLAGALADFVTRLGAAPIQPDAPVAGSDAMARGGSLAARDAVTRQALELLPRDLEPERLAAIWTRCAILPPRAAPAVWLHGDLAAGNLIVRDGRLAGVIDWGTATLGDPAADLQPAWNLFDASARAAFRRHLDLDDATWGRGLGWALSVAALQYPYYRVTRPALAAHAERTLRAILQEEADR